MNQTPFPGEAVAPEKLQLFAATLSGLPKDEVRKAKVLFVRNALSECRAARDSFKAFGCLMIFFAIIPFFWPILLLQRRQLRIQMNLMKERIQNMLYVWKDDLQGEQFDLQWLDE